MELFLYGENFLFVIFNTKIAVGMQIEDGFNNQAAYDKLNER